jgi:hypothetical protein
MTGSRIEGVVPCQLHDAPPHTQATDYGYTVRMNLEAGAGRILGYDTVKRAAVSEIGLATVSRELKGRPLRSPSHGCTSWRSHREIDYYRVKVNGFDLCVTATDLKPAINRGKADVLIRSHDGHP